CRTSGSSLCTIGIAKASVLPEPVCDRASVSLPAVASSIAIAWMANGWTMPRDSSVETTSGETPSSVNVDATPRGYSGLHLERAVESSDEMRDDQELSQRQRLAPSLASIGRPDDADHLLLEPFVRTQVGPDHVLELRAQVSRTSAIDVEDGHGTSSVRRRRPPDRLLTATAKRTDELPEPGVRQRRPYEQPCCQAGSRLGVAVEPDNDVGETRLWTNVRLSVPLS